MNVFRNASHRVGINKPVCRPEVGSTARQKRLLIAISAFILGIGNQTAARAELISSLYSTGVAVMNPDGTPASLVAQGSTDPHYSIIIAPAPDVAGSAFVVVQSGYPFFGHSAAWPTNGGLSNWIAPHPNENSLNGGAPSEPAGQYVYQTTFDLSGFNAFSASIFGVIHTDNSLTGITLNGNNTGVTGGGFSGSSFMIDSGFIDGINVLDIGVYNLPSSHANPSGFDLEITGIAEPEIPLPNPNSVPLPSNLIFVIEALFGGGIVAFLKRHGRSFFCRSSMPHM